MVVAAAAGGLEDCVASVTACHWSLEGFRLVSFSFRLWIWFIQFIFFTGHGLQYNGLGWGRSSSSGKWNEKETEILKRHQLKKGGEKYHKRKVHIANGRREKNWNIDHAIRFGTPLPRSSWKETNWENSAIFQREGERTNQQFILNRVGWKSCSIPLSFLYARKTKISLTHHHERSRWRYGVSSTLQLW